MNDAWYLAALPEFGLAPDCVIKADARRVAIGLGDRRGCLWRYPSTPRDQALLLAWEDRLRAHGVLAARLAARGGAPWVQVDERTVAVLTCWDGGDLPRPAGAQDLAPLARFLGWFRSFGEAAGLQAPERRGLDWMESWDERCRRLGYFARLAAERLNPTRFDLVYLEHYGYYEQLADRSAAELRQDGSAQPCGVALNEADRRRFHTSPRGLCLKSVLGLGRELPVRDLYRLIARTLPHLDWPLDAGAAIVAAYGGECTLTAADVRVLQAALRFPHDLYRLACHYFLNHKGWPLRTFLRRQEEIRRREGARQRFVEGLPLLLP